MSLRIGARNLEGRRVYALMKSGMDKTFFVSIMTNPRKTVLYTGVTNNLPRRVHEHKGKLTLGFASGTM